MRIVVIFVPAAKPPEPGLRAPTARRSGRSATASSSGLSSRQIGVYREQPSSVAAGLLWVPYSAPAVLPVHRCLARLDPAAFNRELRSWCKDYSLAPALVSTLPLPPMHSLIRATATADAHI
jgi:hypothetical protein